MPSSWLPRLVQVALGPPSPSRLDELVELVATACGASSAILWEAAANGAGDLTPTIVAMSPAVVATSPGQAGPRTGSMPPAPDPITVAALESRSLALPSSPALGTPVSRATVLAALPVDFVDGSRGALTLVGAGRLRVEWFDLAADLLEVLPGLRALIRERQTLSLVNQGNDVLRDPEVEPAQEELRHERLVEQLTRVCEAIAAALGCADVSVRLQDPEASDDTVPVIASWSDRPEAGCTDRRLTTRRCPGDGIPGGAIEATVLEAQVATGAHVWGVISCARALGAPVQLARSDVCVLAPLAAQVARFWGSWLQRRTISSEISSWRHLASSVTTFNRLLADELKRAAPGDHRVYAQALQIVRDVVPECTGAAIRRPAASTDGSLALAVECVSGPDLGPDGAGGTDSGLASGEARLGKSVYSSKRQQSVVDPVAIASEGLDPSTHWIISTPVSAGAKAFGVLDVFGPSREPPANSPQVCEIVSDQLGLYQHLEQTLHHLRQARTRLESTTRGQAEALQDLEHQLVSPLLAATSRTERVLQSGRFDPRTASQLRAIRGLCRKASRVALSAGVFAALSEGRAPVPRLDLHGADDLLRLLIAAADDAQLLSNPRRRITFDVDRDSVRALGRRLALVDRTFLEQCVGNVLDNATKYSYEDTRVEITGVAGEDWFAIDVTNTGLALQSAEAVHCLERNWRGPLARTSSGEGSGLGLWIVDNLMRSVDGSVIILPSVDRTSVRLQLPLTDTARKARN